MVREIVVLGDPVLRTRAARVDRVDATVRRLMDDLAATLEAAGGVGLAAPQIGVSRRVIVCHVGDRSLALANPIVSVRAGREFGPEGCLSLPGVIGQVNRSLRVRVRGLDRAGRQIAVDAEGLLARVAQHELDHLDGVLIIDRTPRLWWQPEPTVEITAAGDAARPTTAAEVEAYFADRDFGRLTQPCDEPGDPLPQRQRRR